MKKIIFVCLGNICRSPLAEGIAKSIVEKKNLNIEIDSAGTGNYHIGESPCPNSIKVAKLNGVDISNQKARQVKKQDFKEFDLIVALDEQNRLDLLAMGAKNVKKLGEFGRDGESVPDPYFFNGFDGFNVVYEMIEECVNNLLEENF